MALDINAILLEKVNDDERSARTLLDRSKSLALTWDERSLAATQAQVYVSLAQLSLTALLVPTEVTITAPGGGS